MAEQPVAVTVYFVFTVEICVSAALSVIWFIRKHIQAQKAKHIRSKTLFYGSITFFVSVVFYFIINSLVGTSHPAVLYASSFSYVTQFGFMVGLLLLRLYIIFKGTSFELSTLTIYIFSGVYIATFIMGHIAAYARNFLYYTWWHHSVKVYFFMVMGLAICFIGLFLYKLISVFRQTGHAGAEAASQRLIATITKVFLLSTISIFWSLIFAVMTSVYQYLPGSTHMTFWWKMLAWIDVYTNFLGILLGFQHFQHLYMKCCKHCDAGCRSICARMWLGEDVDVSSVNDYTTASATKGTDLTVSVAISTVYTASDKTMSDVSSNKINN